MTTATPPPAPAPGFLTLQLWAATGPLRLAPLWTLGAGAALAQGVPAWDWPPRAAIVQLLLAALLVEALWGAVWAQLHALPTARQPAMDSDPPPLPYARTQAPLGRWWRWVRGETRHAGGRDAWLALTLALIVAAALGPAALIATLAAALLAALAAWFAPALPAVTRLLAALLAVALPWALGFQLLAAGDVLAWPQMAQLPVWLLLACFTLLRFGLDQWQGGGGRGWYAMALLALLALLGWQGKAVAAVIALLLLGLAAWRLPPARQHGWQWLALLAVILLWS